MKVLLKSVAYDVSRCEHEWWGFIDTTQTLWQTLSSYHMMYEKFCIFNININIIKRNKTLEGFRQAPRLAKMINYGRIVFWILRWVQIKYTILHFTSARISAFCVMKFVSMSCSVYVVTKHMRHLYNADMMSVDNKRS